MRRRDALAMLTAATGFAGLSRTARAAGTGDGLTGTYWAEYQGIVRAKLDTIRATESDVLLEAAHRMAETRRNGGTCWSLWDLGHSTSEDLFPDRPGDPGILTPGYEPDDAKEGDLLIANVFGSPIEDPREKGVFVIGAQAPWCGDTPDAERLLSEKHRNLRIRPYSDLWINTYLSTLGPEVWLPGAQYPMGALSGVLGMVTMWMMMADAVRTLAAGGSTVTVRGDEPEFTENPDYVGLGQPLGDAYFDIVTGQLRQIDAELGTVRDIAKKAVDTILAGGRVHVYSRYWTTLSIEANTRRGGLTVFHSVDSDRHPDYTGTDRDFVIMGIYQPDDPVDTEYLAKFRAAGTPVASIGPVTRNKKADYDTIPFKTDHHIGHMCGTYGVFAVPEVTRTVCPTSGVMVNQLFYAVCFLMAEYIIARTGNTPYIYPNGAIEGPPYAEFSRVHQAGRKRGY